MDKVYKKGLSIFLVLLMVMSGITGVVGSGGGKASAAASDFAGGTGTASDPYQIATADQLDLVRNYLGPGLYFKLIADIDLSSYANWVSIGTTIGPGYTKIEIFYGDFDGNGFKIKNLKSYDNYSSFTGLFSRTGGNITNMGLENVDVSGVVAGSLAGVLYSGTISNSYATGVVSANYSAGGLVGGQNPEGTIWNCYTKVSVSSKTNYSYSSGAGGLVGWNNGPISNSYSIGSVSGGYFAGGLVGINYSSINNSYATGSVNGGTFVGGLIGNNYGTITQSFYDSSTTGQSDIDKGTGKTTAEMKGPTTFSDWNFSEDWYMLTGHYPELWAFVGLTPGTNVGTTKLTGVSSEMEYKVNLGSYTPILYTSLDNIVVGVGDKIYLRVMGAAQPALAEHIRSVDAKDIKIVTIQSATVDGVTVPVTGATPVATIADTSEYTAAIAWNPSDVTFAGAVSYTATVTITPKAGYTLKGVPANFFTVAGATTTNAADSGIVTAVFPETEAAPITTAAIAGVTAPAAGEIPVDALADTAEYTAAIAWSPADAKFTGAAIYTAKITLTAKPGYTLAGVAKDFFTVAGATTTNDADSGVVTAVFPATASASISTAAIAGVVLPVTGGTPVATVPETAEYTASVAWTPADATFAGGTDYTATITITPKPGYTLAGVPEYFFSVPGAITTNTADSGVVIAKFPATAIIPATAVPITAAGIEGVTSPITGATPVTTATYSPEYTATVSWSPATTVFAPGTAYTATITITPRAGYTLTGVPANFFTVAGANTTTTADSGVVTAEFPSTATVPDTEPPVTVIPITVARVAGITVPVAGAIPVTTATYSPEYTATVSWSPATTVFVPGTAYTATITITPKPGFTLSGVPAYFFSVPGASTTNTANSGVVTAEFPATAPVITETGSGNIVTPSSNNIITSTNGKITLPVNQAGEVSLEDGVKISIPAGAAAKELIVSIEKVLEPQKLFPNKEILLSAVYEITKNFAEDFSKPVTMKIAFDPALVTSSQQASVFYYDEVKKVWIEAAGGKIEGNHIIVEVDHFGKYAVLSVDKVTGLPVRAPVTDNSTEIDLRDVAGHWAAASIQQALNMGMVKGYLDGTFRPNHSVTRAEFAVMLMNVLKPQSAGARLTFTDTATIGAWAQSAIAQAVQAGIITGYEDGGFRPNAEITRAEMAVILAKALGESAEVKLTTSFADDKDIPAWAKGSVDFVEQSGIVQGKGNNEFDPQDSATRAEAVTVLLKLLAEQNK